MQPITVALRFNPEEKAMLVELAARLQRDQTATLRALVKETLAILREQDSQASPQATARPRGKRSAKAAMPQEWRKVN